MNTNSRKRCVAGNWKMNGSKDMISKFIPQLLEKTNEKTRDTMDILLCPPFVYLEAVFNLIKGTGIGLGGQNVYCEEKGAYTGEISSLMLKDMGCEAVIVGHSERRQLFGESDELVAKKFARAYDTGLIPILCVGETRKEREEGVALEVIRRQLTAVTDKVTAMPFLKAMIAYEPVWAIGTGLTATPEQAEEVHAFIRDWVSKQDKEAAESVRILYGGSVKGDNAAGLFAMPNIDGALVGGASLDAVEFSKICL